jgi:phosphatidylethanolamine/phosphatidyl-N-methylethanolamine N-methyltransferase
LSELITSEIKPSSGPIIELGPGTGVFTRKLLEKGIRQQDLTLIEYGADFVEILQSRFPGARVLRMDAAHMVSLKVAEDASIGSIVSGLPLLSMPPKKVISILGGAFRYMRADGAFYQFTYGPQCPIPRPILDRLGLKATRVGRTMRNVPPAAVYRVTRRAPSRFSIPPATPKDGERWRRAAAVLRA